MLPAPRAERQSAGQRAAAQSGEESPDAWIRNSSTGTPQALRELPRRIECLRFACKNSEPLVLRRNEHAARANYLGGGPTTGPKTQNPGRATNRPVPSGPAQTRTT